MAQAPTAEQCTARRRLSRAAVVDEALELADREGVDALTMRGLAEALGVGTMTLYGYFPSKRELLDAVVKAVVADAPVPDLAGGWRSRLRRLAIVTRAMLVRHPSLVEIRTRRPVVGAEALSLTERATEILIEAGFDRREAALSFRLVFVYVFGFAALSPARSEAEDRATARAALAALPPDEYPSLTAAVEESAAAMGGDAVFEYGLDRLLDGLEARLAAAQPSARP